MTPRFLHNLRLSYFKKGKVFQYLSYALGEILLVVIGILLALQINNWNQERQDLKKAIEYHNRMIEDLENTKSFLGSVSEFSNKVTNGIDDAIVILESGVQSDSSKKTLDFALGNFFRLSRNLPELTTYNEMESSGQLGLIYNTSLRKEIANYMVNWKLVSTASEDLNEKVNQTAFIDPYVKFSRDASFQESKLEYDFEALAADRKVINTLSRYSFHWKTKIAFAKILASEATELKEKIKEELIRLQ